MTLALGTRLVSNGGGSVTPGELPILRRDLLEEDNFFILLEDSSKVVITFGTFDSIVLEDGSFLLIEDSGKFIVQAN